MTKLGDRIVDLERENAELRQRLDEALAQQAASAEVLGVINSFPGDLTPVFAAILEKAMRFCEAAFGLLLTFDGDTFHVAAHRGLPAQFAKFIQGMDAQGWRGAHMHLIDGAPFVHVLDLSEDRATYDALATRRALVDLGGARSIVLVPLRHEDRLIGSLAIYRQEVRPFANRQIALLQNFADQAVLAMHNARLMTETRERTAELQEALEYQTATAEVLKIVASSPDRLAPVFDAMLERATALCDVEAANLYLHEAGILNPAAVRHPDPQKAAAMLNNPLRPGPTSALARVLDSKAPVHIADLADDEAYRRGDPFRVRMVDEMGVRALLAVPLLRQGEVVGVMVVHRPRPEAFTTSQIDLVKTFSDQAVIAIENARLLGELRERTDDLTEALKYQTATNDVLKVLSNAAFDLKSVLERLIETAVVLCDGRMAFIYRRHGEVYKLEVSSGFTPEYHAYMASVAVSPGPGSLIGRVTASGRPVHIIDAVNDPDYTWTEARQGGQYRTMLGVPMIREGEILGVIAVTREVVKPFAATQIELMTAFADQAVIAIENARLLGDLRERTADLTEALEYQTATSDVLKVISRSTLDLQPVLDTVVETANRLCQADGAGLTIREGDAFHYVAATTTLNEELFAELRKHAFTAGRDTMVGRVALEGDIVHIADISTDPDYRLRGVLGDIRTLLGVPLLRDGVVIGTLNLTRRRIEPFTERQIELVQTFADQAVIAIENARLLTETHEALDQQTATAEVLGVINSSPGDLAPVFDAMLEKAVRLCDGTQGIFWTYDGDRFQATAFLGVTAEFAAVLREPVRLPAESPLGRVVHGEPYVQILDMADTEVYRGGFPLVRAVVDLGKVRSLVVVPLLKDGTATGIFAVARDEVRPFSDKQIALLQNFAAQAVIAMENTRLIIETREALEQQTATAEVLGVINSSPGNLTPVFQAILDKAHRLCGATRGTLFLFDGRVFRAVASHGYPKALSERPLTIALSEDPRLTALHAGEPLIHVPDLTRLDDPIARAVAERGGVRTNLLVPLRKEGTLLGVLSCNRHEVRPFSEKQVALLQNFAAQAVIAMENARLIIETREARDAAERALGELKAAQANLIQAEKMASLGQLTAGIAHEIKNPLNFVNNFASLSVELLDELKEAAAPALETLAEDKREELDETIGMLTGNLEKIAEHGRRADNIVKSMLEHSRGVSGERREVDLNALVEESLNLAYHGARAQDQSFNITLERDFDAALKPIELVPQDMTRVFLNLFGNGFYAANKRAQANGAQRKNGASDGGATNGGFRPVLHVATREAGDAVEVKVRDNGTGIPASIRDKLFQPFFTTKPTGEGTGLGLSISYDIVTQQHGGTIAVDSEEGSFTEFTIRLPRQGAQTRPGAGNGVVV